MNLWPRDASRPDLLDRILAGLVLGLAIGAPGCGFVTTPRSAGDDLGSLAPARESSRIPGQTGPECCTPDDPAGTAAQSGESLSLDRITVPESTLIDQDGRAVDLARDLIGNRVAAIQFVFTRCTTTCPILGNQFGQVRALLSNRMCKDFALISISVDPEFDRPDVFKAWGERYGVGAGWSMVTGPKVEVDHLLKKLGTFAADRENHQSQVLILDGATGRGLRTSGLAAPADLVKVLRGVRALRPGTGSRQALSERNADAAAQRYFSDTILVDQSGRRHCFHADLLRGKVVVINVFFSACNGSCVAMANTLAALQKKLGDRLERDVRLISISVDSRNDSPAVLSTYAQRYEARPGWYFLTGEEPNVDSLLRKLGQYVEVRENHSAILLVGNMHTGLWKKIFGLADPDEVISQIETVINDDAADQ